MPKLAVLGFPVGHSRSPAMQNAALRELGLAPEWTYEAIEVTPGDFEARVRAMPGEGFAGANATVPHKVAALAVADRASHAAAAIGAANTLRFTDAGIEAENTDAPGLVAALPASPEGKRALVLGAGGAARACAWALREEGAEVSIWNRTRAKAEQLANELFDVAIWDPETSDHDLIVNCTTVGLEAASAAADASAGGHSDLKPLPFDADALRTRHVVVDLVYGPSPTPLALAARSRGATVVDGLEVLVHQGAASLRLWTGLDPPIDAMREAARAFD